ncbi:MAG: 2-C-methyl-D-erythritol 2,4-cyclodiphosphate synthase [Gammaproteobacteria bacterium]|nr:2-C-methyl-D-erythritol 2,4-cyclodiphosphate synthase [Gammaproteobacteria bacterium]
MFRIGHGYDVHRFIDGDHIMLAGVKIDFDRAFEAHSDGDVLLHAVCDALLGASALGDIGQHFPDTDAAYKNIDSRKLLKQVAILVADKGYRLGNLDVTVVAQAPKLAPYIEQMRDNLSKDLAVDLKANFNAVNVKATTTEGLGFTGEKKGIAVHAVCLLMENH